MGRGPVDVTEGKTRLFSSIGIETGAVCNRRCYFCPNAYAERPDEWMPDEVFDKIVSDLAKLRYDGRVEFYIYNEPTRDPRLLKLISKVRGRLPKACLMINTNGDYFKKRGDIVRLFEVGLNQLQINVYNAAEQAGKATSTAKGAKSSQARFDKLQSWIDAIPGVSQTASLYQKIPPSRRAAKVVKKWGGGEAKGGVNHISNRSGNIPDLKPLLDEPMERGCTKPFRFLNINWMGDAILCCNDYHGETTVGNVRERSLEDLWNDGVLQVYRLKLQNKDRDLFFCAGCDFDGGPYQHNIQPVTFGDERDQEILKADLSTIEEIRKAASCTSRSRSRATGARRLSVTRPSD